MPRSDLRFAGDDGSRLVHRFDPRPLLERYPGLNDREISELLGVTRSAVSQWRRGQVKIRVWDADRIARRIGIHPSLIWTDWFDAA